MKKYNESKLNMYLVVQQFLSVHEDDLSPIASVNAYVDEFNEVLTKISQLNTDLAFSPTAHTVLKNEKKEALAIKAIDLARKIRAYAIVQNNTTLSEQMDFTITDLRKSPDALIADTCRAIYDKAFQLGAALTPFGAKAEDTTELHTLINRFSEVMPKPRLSRAERKENMQRLEELFSTCDDLLSGKIDHMLETLRESTPTLYHAYRNARIIIDPAFRKLSVRGAIKATMNGSPIAGVTVKLRDAAGNEIAEAISTKLGNFRMKGIAEGRYDLGFTKAGHETQTKPVVITTGETVRVDIEM